MSLSPKAGRPIQERMGKAAATPVISENWALVVAVCEIIRCATREVPRQSEADPGLILHDPIQGFLPTAQIGDGVDDRSVRRSLAIAADIQHKVERIGQAWELRLFTHGVVFLHKRRLRQRVGKGRQRFAGREERLSCDHTQLGVSDNRHADRAVGLACDLRKGDAAYAIHK